MYKIDMSKKGQVQENLSLTLVGGMDSMVIPTQVGI